MSGRVVVAVLTFRRPDDLAEVLPQLAAQAAAVTTARTWAEVLVVDNDPAAGAREQVEGFAREAVAPVRYAHEPAPGIAAARNRAIDEAGDADVLVFVDDDERPVEGWLRAPLRVHADGRAAGRGRAGGLPVHCGARPVDRRRRLLRAPEPADRHRGTHGGDEQPAARPALDPGSRAALRPPVRHHRRLGQPLHPAGERGRRPAGLVRRGGGARRGAGLADDPRLCARRAYRMGNGTSLVGLELARTPAARTAARFRHTLLGLGRILAGGARVTAGGLTRSMPMRAAGARNLARGLGLITGSFGHSYVEYRRTSAGTSGGT